MKLAASRLEALVWILIYGGLLGASLGYSLARDGVAWGWGVVVVGAAAVLAGAILVWVRSRMGRPASR